VTEVAVVRDAASVAQAACELFVEATAGSVAARRRALVALTGGSSAAPLYAALRSEPWRSRVPWSACEFFSTDERAVAPDHALSNHRIAATELFPHVGVQERAVHRLRGEAPDAAAEARRAADELRALGGTPPRLDLVLLGLGPDGHICSLFPGPGAAQRGDDELYRAVPAPSHVEPHVARITMTPFLVATARTVVVLVTGAAKAPVLARALKEAEDLAATPAQWLRRAVGRVVMVCDPAAAAGL
jgi:6-phosphogluconolactonase